MPFINNPLPPKSARNEYPADEPLLRLTQLYPSKSGKAAMGNVPVATPKRRRNEEDQTDIPFGNVLIDLIQTCMEKQRPLRFILFENTFGGEAKYTINVTMGNPPRPREDRPQAQGDAWPNLPESQDGHEEVAEPAPRPVRRGMPRR